MALPDLGYAIGLPPEKAIEYFETKGYAIGFKWQEVWAEAHAKAFTVAGVTKLDVLEDIRGELNALLKSGGTLQEFKNNLIPKLKQKGWWGKGRMVDDDTGEVVGKRLNPRRLETIFRTNLQAAYSAGRYQAQLEDTDLRPWWEYVAVLDNRTRPRHRALSGQIFRYDDSFWRSFYPPNGWNCRCRVRTRSERDIERKSLATSSSEGRLGETEQIIDKKGTTRHVPSYTTPSGEVFTADAGFGYNPGRAAYQPELDRYDKDAARQYVKGALTGPAFKNWYQGMDQAVGALRQAMPASSKSELARVARQQLTVGQRYPVAVLSPEYQTLLKAEAQTVWLSDDTLAKQLVNRHGQDIELADYWRVQDVIEQAQLIVQDGEQSLVFVRQGDRVYHAAVKATQTGKAMFLTSFRESNKDAAEAAMKRGKVVKNDLIKK
ncbi:phage minor head protein [Chitinibacter sp. ZOR0017]|uniref:phage head morphogenesis protein n=1 Tax=Chitinibacter sp. ZOR0017 TaxID=1339254 RepID=UPI000645C8B4|nr:phage minor head protein [Chitinibacter sp. ZOR0017]